MFLLKTCMLLGKLFKIICIIHCFLFMLGITCLSCCRTQYESSMCLFCTNFFLRNRQIWNVIEKKLSINILNVPIELCSDNSRSYLYITVYSFVDYCSNNIGTFPGEVITSRLVLWKFYLETLASLVFNYSNKILIPSLLSEPFRSSVYCNNMKCFYNKKVDVNETVLFHAITSLKGL